MGWVQKLPNGNYRACWRDLAGRQHSTTVDPDTGDKLTRWKYADRIAKALENDAKRGRSARTGQTPTWGDWLPVWLGARRVEPSTAEIDRVRIARYLEPQWGTTRLNRITRTDVQTWVNQLADGHLAPASVEKVYRLFSASMTAAVLDERLPVTANPCKGVKLPRIAPGHERFLSRGEVDAIAHHLNDPYRLAWLLACGTGMRWGELAGLHWQRVDLGSGVIDIVETWDPTAKRVKAYPKGHNRRAVPIPAWLADALSEALDRLPAGLDRCGQPHAKGGAACRSALVIRGPNGAPMNGRNFGRRQFGNACRDAGLDKMRLHDGRHAYASQLVQAGVPLQEVQRLLGHSSIVTTQRYAHLGTSQNERVLAALA